MIIKGVRKWGPVLLIGVFFLACTQNSGKDNSIEEAGSGLTGEADFEANKIETAPGEVGSKPNGSEAMASFSNHLNLPAKEVAKVAQDLGFNPDKFDSNNPKDIENFFNFIFNVSKEKKLLAESVYQNLPYLISYHGFLLFDPSSSLSQIGLLNVKEAIIIYRLFWEATLNAKEYILSSAKYFPNVEINFATCGALAQNEVCGSSTNWAQARTTELLNLERVAKDFDELSFKPIGLGQTHALASSFNFIKVGEQVITTRMIIQNGQVKIVINPFYDENNVPLQDPSSSFKFVNIADTYSFDSPK